MFCFQCQETARNQGCTIKGVCGKEPQTAALMDLLIYVCRGIAIVQRALRQKGKASDAPDHFLMDALFSTITNANFDDNALSRRIDKGFALKKDLLAQARKEGINVPDMPEVRLEAAPADYQAVAASVGVLSETNEDIRSLKQMTIYGLKGMCAYTEHALNLGHADVDIYTFLEEALYQVSRKDIGADELVSLVLKTGETGVKSMALLDKANTATYGHPQMTRINIGVGKNPGILISGHDLKDMQELLEQTAGTGVDVYTHGEMLPAHYYPAFKKYPHFIGNYGNAWWKQREEFESFNGVILFT
nr:hydroxylamine reductase [Bacteroidales bacterium]